MAYEFEMYQDTAKKWRWRFNAPNGRIMADSGQGYIYKSDCKSAIETIQAEAADAAIVES